MVALVQKAPGGIAIACMLASSACAFNQTGDLEARERGDVSRPAERGSPIAALRNACGDGDFTTTGREVLRRQPYVQLVTPTSARIATSHARLRVEVTRPDGAPVAIAAARPEMTGQAWADLERLEPDTVYCYALSDGRALTERTGFRTAPASAAAPVRFLAFGDSGEGGPDQRALAQWMFDVPAELIVHTGDVAYDDGTLGQYEDNVFGIYHQLLRNLPFYPAAGNHDYRTMQGGPFRQVFSLPGSERWYSFDHGSVHFVALDTEADYKTQARWLADDLAKTSLPWRVVYLHRPPYSSGSHGSDTGLRRALAPVLEAGGVQLVLTGHDHDYERTTPQRGVHYIVTGGGGRGTYGVDRSDFTAFSEAVIHFVYVEASSDELVVHAIDARGAEFDSVAIPLTPGADS